MNIDAKILNDLSHVTREEQALILKMIDLTKMTDPGTIISLALIRDVIVHRMSTNAMVLSFKRDFDSLKDDIERLGNGIDDINDRLSKLNDR